jgi:hypothetical protein
MYDTLDIPNFLSDELIQQTTSRIYETSVDKTELVDKWGVWKGKHVTTQHWVPKDQAKYVFGEIVDKLRTILTRPFEIDQGQILQSHLAYDIHTDYFIQVDRVVDKLEGKPYYTLIIPLADFNSNTIVFNESAEYNEFYKYKEKNTQLLDHISDDDWSKYCSHCWKDDQKYLSLDAVCNWQKGKLIGFDRHKFHCSDNFTQKIELKEAFVLWLREE